MDCKLTWLKSQEATRIDQIPMELGSVPGPISCIAPHASGNTLLIGTCTGEIIHWDPSQAKAVATHKAHSKDVTQIIHEERSKRYLTVSADGFVQWWSSEFHREQGFSAGAALYCASGSPTGRYVAAGAADQLIRIWDAHSGELSHTLEGHAEAVTAIGWISDNILISGDARGSLRCWEVDNRRCYRYSRPHTDQISRIVTDRREGWYLTASWDGSLRVWSNKHKLRFQLPTGPSAISSVDIAPDNRMMVASYWNGTTVVWDLEKAEVFEEFRAHQDELVGCVLLADGQVVITADRSGAMRSWSLATMGVSRYHNLHTGEVYSLTYAPDNTQALSAGHDASLKIWDRASLDEFAVLDAQAGPLTFVTTSPDGQYWALGSSQGTIKLWNTETQSFEADLSGHKDAVSGLAFVADGEHLLSVGWDMKLKIWSMDRRQVVSTLHGHSKEISSLDVSRDGRIAITTSWDSTARVWDLTLPLREYRSESRTLAGHDGRVLACSVRPDGEWIATAGADRKILLWETARAGEPQVLRGHEDAVTTLRFTNDGRLLLSAGRDGNLIAWDVERKVIAGQLNHHTPILSLSISPDGGQVMMGDEQGHVRFVELDYEAEAPWVAARIQFKDAPLWKLGAPPTEHLEVHCIYCGFTEGIKRNQLQQRWKCKSCGESLRICAQPSASMQAVPV